MNGECIKERIQVCEKMHQESIQARRYQNLSKLIMKYYFNRLPILISSSNSVFNTNKNKYRDIMNM